MSPLSKTVDHCGAVEVPTHAGLTPSTVRRSRRYPGHAQTLPSRTVCTRVRPLPPCVSTSASLR
jgi:hypothetical protein